MEEVLYNSLSRYFERLGQAGYVPYNNVYKLLILSFISEIVDNDYRGYITKDDYPYIEQALDCLFGTSCLTPYPN